MHSELERMLSKPQNWTFIVVAVLTNTKTGANGKNTSSSLTKTSKIMTRMSHTIYICRTPSNKTADVHIRVMHTRQPANFI